MATTEKTAASKAEPRSPGDEAWAADLAAYLLSKIAQDKETQDKNPAACKCFEIELVLRDPGTAAARTRLNELLSKGCPHTVTVLGSAATAGTAYESGPTLRVLVTWE